MKKFLSILLAIFMLAVMLPVTAMAEEGATGDGSQSNPYTLAQLGAMDRDAYITAQKRLGGTMYVTVGNYSYDTNGVLGSGTQGTADKTTDNTKLNTYAAPGAKSGQYSDAAVGRNIVFVNGTITNNVKGYASIDGLATSLLLGVPAYTNVRFEGIEFNGVFNFTYQTWTSPWSLLGNLEFENCTFNGLIIGYVSAQKLTFNGCTFTNYTNTSDANNSNPIWVRPGNGNGIKNDTLNQSDDFRSLTSITFTNNKVTGTRPVKFERISQWEVTTKLTATSNSFDIKSDGGKVKNIGMYFGADAAFNLVVEKNTKSADTAALYTLPENQNTLPVGSTIKNTNNTNVKLTDVVTWKQGVQVNLDPSGDGVEEIITPPTDGPSTIVIITPTEDTPKTEPEKNPTTGANDVVAAAVALMAVSALGMAVLARKK